MQELNIKMLRFAIFFSILLTKSLSFEEIEMICSDDFCTKYIEQHGCPELSEACRVQNSTHNGVYLPYPDICNCCDYCVTNLAENDICSRGSPGLPPPDAICGPGLSCTSNKNGPSTCQPMDKVSNTACTKAQYDHDERRKSGTLGMTEVRPKCDDDGVYLQAHCIPGSICYCVSTDGKRIFGEMAHLRPSDEHKMTCGCSLNHWKAMQTVHQYFKDVSMTARCNDYGLYDPLQCMMGPEADCLCVDPLTGEPKFNSDVVPFSKLKNGKLSCYDPSIHNGLTYESECEIMKIKWKEETTSTIATIATTKFDNPQCQPDGKFDRLQILGTNFMRICVDPSGNQIDNYQASESPDEHPMDCNCARTRWILSRANVTELPKCCKDGSFEAWQCRREQCFCVDQNGDQFDVEVPSKDVTKLSCYKENDSKPCKFS